MIQKEEELITHFVARLWTLVKCCEFSVTYPNKQDCGWCIDYASDMVAEQMVTGLANLDHQTKILTETTTLIAIEI